MYVIEPLYSKRVAWLQTVLYTSYLAMMGCSTIVIWRDRSGCNPVRYAVMDKQDSTKRLLMND
jgi:hypothetical protein